MKIDRFTVAQETEFAKSLYGELPESAFRTLQELLRRHNVSAINGDVKVFYGGWYITHSGLLRLAERRHCAGIHTRPLLGSSDPGNSRWVFKAVVFKSRECKGFVGYGDADPSNVSPLVHGAEMRIAETRAVNRALRKAYGIGICSVEELGSCAESVPSNRESKKLPPQSANRNPRGPKVRERLCELIRHHHLDGLLVKAYAADFCGTKTLREATREQVENFVQHLADSAEKDRNALLCQLNGYLSSNEGAA
jgi:hypothetical protein